MVACNFSVEPIPSQCSRVIFSKWKMGTFAKNALNSCLMRIVLSLLKPWLLKESSSVTLPLPFALIHVSGLILIIRKFEKYHMQSFPKEIKTSRAFLRLPPVFSTILSYKLPLFVKCFLCWEKRFLSCFLLCDPSGWFSISSREKYHYSTNFHCRESPLLNTIKIIFSRYFRFFIYLSK